MFDSDAISVLLRDRYHPTVFPYSELARIPDGWLTGAVLMIRKSIFEDVGILDERYHFMMEDADWGLAVSRSGWETWFVPAAVITHLLGASRKALSLEREYALKMRCQHQRGYYIRKNRGFARYAFYRAALSCCYLVNLFHRALQAITCAPDRRAQATLKAQLAWRLLLASMGVKHQVNEKQ